MLQLTKILLGTLVIFTARIMIDQLLEFGSRLIEVSNFLETDAELQLSIVPLVLLTELENFLEL